MIETSTTETPMTTVAPMKSAEMKPTDKAKVVELLTDALKYKRCLVDLHEDMSDVAQFASFHGFKRWHETQFEHEHCEWVCLRRYINDQYLRRVLVTSDYKPYAYKSINTSLKSEVTNAEKIFILKDMIRIWFAWEDKYMEKLEAIVYKLTAECDTLSKEHIEKLICNAKEEVKELRRVVEKYEGYGWDLAYILREQGEMHDKHEKKMKELYHLDIA